jgi:hypothetical protein
MLSVESYVVICFVDQCFYNDIKALVEDRLNCECLRYEDELVTFEELDLLALKEEWKNIEDLPRHIVLFGISELVDINKSEFNCFKQLYRAGKRSYLIPASKEWSINSWRDVDLKNNKLTPTEQLLNVLCQGKGKHPFIDKDFLKIKYLGQSLQEKHYGLALKLTDEEHYHALKELAFLRISCADRDFLVPALLLFLHRQQTGNQCFYPPVFVFFYDDEMPVYEKNGIKGTVSKFDFYSSQSDFGVLRQHCDTAHLTPYLTYTGIYTGKNDNFGLRLSFDWTTVKIEQINKFISQSCLTLMGNNRLLRHYSCTFYLPVYSADKSIVNLTEQIKPIKYGESDNQDQAQAYLYFQPPVRDYLFDTSAKSNSLSPIREWSLDKVGDFLLSLKLPNCEKIIEADISDVRLYQYFNNLCMLAVSVKPAGQISKFSSMLFETKDERWWYCLAFSELNEWRLVKNRQMYSWLAFTKLARLLFASFKEQVDEGKIARTELLENIKDEYLIRGTLMDSAELKIKPVTENNFSEIIGYLLSRFFKTDDAYKACFNNKYHLVFDDRMFVNVAYGYVGPMLGLEAADKLFKLALYVDTDNDTWSSCQGYAYDPDFLAELGKKQIYNRWRANGILSGYTSYSNVYLGNDDFFCDVIAKAHVPLIYGRMLLIALFYQASLRYYNRRIMEETIALEKVKDIDKSIGAIQELRKDFIRFTNIYWFHEVTSQTQGQEIFDLQQQALGLKQEYEFIKDEMERMDEYLQGIHNREMAKQSKQLNATLMFFTVAALLFSFLQIFLVDTDQLDTKKNIVEKFNWLISPFLKDVNLFFQVAAKPMALILGIVLLGIVLYTLVMFCRRWLKKKWPTYGLLILFSFFYNFHNWPFYG